MNGDLDERLSWMSRDAPAPPPSPTLLAAVAGMAPVRPRRRFGAFTVVLAVGAAWPLLSLMRGPWRPDFWALPQGWVVAGAALWAVGTLATLAAAVVPRAGDVLPSGPRAARVGVMALTALLLFALCGTVSVPGLSLHPADAGKTLWQTCVSCGGHVLAVGAVFLVVGAAAFRRALPVGGAAVGLALGLAGGAAGGLVLHFLCPFADTAHVAISHVGGMALAGVLGALALPAAVHGR